jgi:hypothetical protein
MNRICKNFTIWPFCTAPNPKAPWLYYMAPHARAPWSHDTMILLQFSAPCRTMAPYPIAPCCNITMTPYPMAPCKNGQIVKSDLFCVEVSERVNYSYFHSSRCMSSNWLSQFCSLSLVREEGRVFLVHINRQQTCSHRRFRQNSMGAEFWNLSNFQFKTS